MNKSTARTLILAATLAATLSTMAAPPETVLVAPDGITRFQTGPAPGDGKALALAYLADRRGSLDLTEGDLEQMVLRDDYVSAHNGVRHLYWRQSLNGIMVWNGDIAVNVMPDGRIINVHNGFVPDLARKLGTTRARMIDARSAIMVAARDRGIAASDETLVGTQRSVGASAKQVWTWPEVSADPIETELVYMPSLDRSSVRLAWDMVIRENKGPGWWSIRVDALNGEVLDTVSWVAHQDPTDSAARTSRAKGGAMAQYSVYPFPSESPDGTGQVLVSDPHDATASPFGWHDTNGAVGFETNDTVGNNVAAREDLDFNDTGGATVVGSGSSPLVFAAVHTPADDPAQSGNLAAATVNLFYWNNIMHDLTYQYGFDEAGGNFQVNNYGRGGVGNDRVNADVLDGSGTNNANFGTPPDGGAPRMQMFRWSSPLVAVVNTPPGIAGSYPAAAASFGAAVTLAGFTADLQLVNDGTGTLTDGCEAMAAGSLASRIAVIDRGGCEFGVKGLNAQNAGAIGFIVVNNIAGPPSSMGPGAVGAQVTISGAMVSQADGTLIKGQLPSPGVNLTLRKSGVDRDSDFDAGIIAHEYGHGISNRLTGGPSNASCLATNLSGGLISEQGGEGWSDFWALVMFAKSTDTALTPRFIGTYSAFHPTATGPGIRNFPYSTDPLVSPQTYANVATTNAPHGVGEIWAGALWNLYWLMVENEGFDADLYNGNGGNNKLIQLVVDGMKLQPCQPTMVQARDAILSADLANNAGANTCRIWRAFAAKGLGVNAVGGTFARGNETADSTVPLQCETFFVFANGFE